MTTNLIGMAAIVRAAYERRDLTGLLAALKQRALTDPLDTPAFLDLSTVLEVCGQHEKSIELQGIALSHQRLFQTINGSGGGLCVLLIKTAGNLMANTPVEFLLESSDTRLLSLYVDAELDSFPSLPEHDVAILAIGELQANSPVLELLERWQALWPKPILNNAPQRIEKFARERLAAEFVGSRHVMVPETFSVELAMLRELAIGRRTLNETLPGVVFPIIARPFGAHAGHGTQKIEGTEQISDYLRHNVAVRFTITPFIDYASSDGYYRKQRIVFIDGRPFASHMAVSEHWMVHYLNAKMESCATRREQEAVWMEHFDSDFAARHTLAFGEIIERIGLDYFGIDCGELTDGRLILFEADNAMIVHAMDPPDLFPYKMPAMRKLFDAFEGALQRHATRGTTAHNS